VRILWLSHESGLAGAELSLAEAARGIQAKGHEVHVVVPAQEQLADLLAADGIPVSVVRYTWWVGTGARRAVPYRLRRLARNLLAGIKLASVLGELKPDLVVSNTLAICAGAFVSRWAGVPHVWYIHELFGKEGHNLFFDFGEPLSLRLMNRLSDRILVNSYAVRRQFQDWIPSEKLALVYYAVEVPPAPAPTERNDHRFRLIHVGRLSPGKRQEDAIRAHALLVKKGLDARLTLVGSEQPDYGAFLRKLTRELGLEEVVEFIAFTPDPFSVVAASDVALMCSRGEGFGRVTIEAMKLGKPVIGARSGGTAELIQEGRNGFLYRLGDAEELATKIETLYRDKSLVTEMGRHAQEWSQRTFTREAYASRLIDIFQEAIDRRARAGRKEAADTAEQISRR
jgi:glycosyltransferase involved in cell wall biosynthesis